MSKITAGELTARLDFDTTVAYVEKGGYYYLIKYNALHQKFYVVIRGEGQVIKEGSAEEVCDAINREGS